MTVSGTTRVTVLAGLRHPYTLRGEGRGRPYGGGRLGKGWGGRGKRGGREEARKQGHYIVEIQCRRPSPHYTYTHSRHTHTHGHTKSIVFWKLDGKNSRPALLLSCFSRSVSSSNPPPPPPTQPPLPLLPPQPPTAPPSAAHKVTDQHDFAQLHQVPTALNKRTNERSGSGTALSLT